MHRRYALVLVGLSALLVLALGLYGRSFEPLDGDLTRIGRYSENAFGWHLPKERFEPLAASVGTEDGAYDVIAVGDSFTGEAPYRPGTTWPHYLARATGLRVGIFDSDDDQIGRLIASEGFRLHPPAVVIYEVVERQFIATHRSAPGDACPTEQARPRTVLPYAEPLAGPIPVTRRTGRAWTDLPVTYVLDYAWQNLRRWAVGRETTSAVRLDLTRGGMFSSRSDRGLLVYAEDFNKMSWQPADWQGAACALLRLQAQVQSNGRTTFLAMVAPDKLTTYGPFLAEPSFRGISRLAEVARVPGLNLVRLDQAFDPTRHVDLYLPDDTHWSTVGHALAAEQVIATLKRDHLIATR
jgi:hypothetical protein